MVRWKYHPAYFVRGDNDEEMIEIHFWSLFLTNATCHESPSIFIQLFSNFSEPPNSTLTYFPYCYNRWRICVWCLAHLKITMMKRLSNVTVKAYYFMTHLFWVSALFLFHFLVLRLFSYTRKKISLFTCYLNIFVFASPSLCWAEANFFVYSLMYSSNVEFFWIKLMTLCVYAVLSLICQKKRRSNGWHKRLEH